MTVAGREFTVLTEIRQDYVHAWAVVTRLSFPPPPKSLGTRLELNTEDKLTNFDAPSNTHKFSL